MEYCPKCGEKVSEDMAFCPKCGASLKVQQVPVAEARPSTYRHEKAESREKQEKQEKGEKTEKQEKGEHSFIGPLVGGLVLMLIGATLYLEMVGIVRRELLWAFFFVLIGIVIIIGAVYGALLTTRRHPRT